MNHEDRGVSAVPPRPATAILTTGADACPLPEVTRVQALIDNLPYLAMLVLGAAVLQHSLAAGAWPWLAAAAYFLYGVAGAVWIMVFICPHCHFHGTRLCPCGYGEIAARLRAKRPGEDFRRQFRRHIPVIVPLWFVPLLVGVAALIQAFSWPVTLLLLGFALNSFVILPLVSRAYGCARCPQKATCPWMGVCRQAA